MLILGSTFLGADFSFSPTPTKVDKITKLNIMNASFDTLLVTENTGINETYSIDTTWGNDTIMCATFDNSLSAGNVDYVLANTSDIIIKRREKGAFSWTTIYHKQINNLEDFNILFVDYMAKSNKTYQYACVGMLNGAEGTYNIEEIDSEFDGMFIIGYDSVYGTELDVGSCDTQRKHYAYKKELPNKKYPGAFSNSIINYDYGTAEGFFVRYNTDDGETYETDSVDYRHDVIDFLSDNKPKILKHEDGRMWLISIDGEPTDTESSHYLHRLTQFSWYESGDYLSEKDLYDSGISDVPSEFWSNV